MRSITRGGASRRRLGRVTLWAGPAALALAATVASPASADEPVAASEPRLLSETAEVTSVVDAFDKDDPFDLNLTLGFQQTWKHANIRRETSLLQPNLASGGFVPATENVAAYSSSMSVLNIGADIGVFRDLAIIARLPFILSFSQQLGDLNGSQNVAAQRLQDPAYPGTPLFTVPFNSPTRSGIDYFSVGVDYAIFNQQRDETKPTWVLGVEGRLSVGTPLHACSDRALNALDTSQNPPQNTTQTRKCPDPANPLAADRDPGISRGMNSIAAHTVFSRRFGYVEPYAGFWFLADFPNNAPSNDFQATNNLRGALVNHPPLVGTFGMGLEVIPYEHRESFQRLVADFRVRGTYHSPGREYSELFDALGSSQAASLRSPNPGGYTAGAITPTNPLGSVADPSAQKVYFTGITDQQGYGSIGAHAAATWQAGEYVKFQVGAGFTFNQQHLITSADSCNPNFTNDTTKAGPCHTTIQTGNNTTATVTGIPNPNHRDVIDLPGHRFSVDDTTIVDLWVSGVVMF
jgi:hypothetical protein